MYRGSIKVDFLVEGLNGFRCLSVSLGVRFALIRKPQLVLHPGKLTFCT